MCKFVLKQPVKSIAIYINSNKYQLVKRSGCNENKNLKFKETLFGHVLSCHSKNIFHLFFSEMECYATH